MKNFIRLLIILQFFAPAAFAQCEEPSIDTTGKKVAAGNFEIKNQTAPGEMILTLEAAAKNSSWETKGAESAVLAIFVDGKYNQDVLLFAGAEKFAYQVVLGKFAAGKHKVAAILNEARSAKNARDVKIFKLVVEPNAAQSPEDKFAVANAPVLYARPDTIDRFSDIPLFTYYEIFPLAENYFKIRYTTIFTNEDGGTQTAALMARWGRVTDIEWVYEIEAKNGAIASEIIQAASHVTKNFGGRRIFGEHPLIYDATVNNNFADAGCSALRTTLLPVRADLSKKSREDVMDENPWTYRIMAQEAVREGRINPQNLGANTIDDLRNYLYVEVYSQNASAAVAVGVKTTDGKTSRSDFDDARLRVDRSGYQRIAVRSPSPDSPVQSLNLFCEAVSPQKQVSGECRDTRIVKFIRLDKNYNVLETQNPANESRSIKTGERLDWFLER